MLPLARRVYNFELSPVKEHSDCGVAEDTNLVVRNSTNKQSPTLWMNVFSLCLGLGCLELGLRCPKTLFFRDFLELLLH